MHYLKNRLYCSGFICYNIGNKKTSTHRRNDIKKLLVIDGNSILNRAFYGIRPLTTKTGLHTNAIYGFVNILLKNLQSLSPDYAAVAFDLKAPTFRHKEYAEYKAGRHATPEELIMQMPYAKKLASALGFAVLEKEGYEADDILGTLARMGDESCVESYVLTGDRDSLQLITDNTKVLLAGNQDTDNDAEQIQSCNDQPAVLRKERIDEEAVDRQLCCA